MHCLLFSVINVIRNMVLLRFSLLAKASMSLLRVFSFGDGRVGQKLKPLCNKLVSDRVSFNEDNLTILLLRISAFLYF